MSDPSIALIVVDVQEGFVNRHSEHVVPSVLRLASSWVSSGRPTYFTRFHNRPGSAWERLIGWPLMHGPPETDLIAELRPIADRGIVVDKHRYSCLGPPIADDLTDLKLQAEAAQAEVPTVVICGIATEACVLMTAVDVFELGLRPLVALDACASNEGDHYHQAGVAVLGQVIGREQLVTVHGLRGLLPP